MKSLAPYNDEYVLIHKRTLLVNSMALTAMTEFISQNSSLSSEQAALLFGDSANKIVSNMTDKEVSNNANGLVAKSIINDGVSSVVEHERGQDD